MHGGQCSAFAEELFWFLFVHHELFSAWYLSLKPMQPLEEAIEGK